MVIRQLKGTVHPIYKIPPANYVASLLLVDAGEDIHTTTSTQQFWSFTIRENSGGWMPAVAADSNPTKQQIKNTAAENIEVQFDFKCQCRKKLFAQTFTSVSELLFLKSYSIVLFFYVLQKNFFFFSLHIFLPTTNSQVND